MVDAVGANLKEGREGAAGMQSGRICFLNQRKTSIAFEFPD